MDLDPKKNGKNPTRGGLVNKRACKAKIGRSHKGDKGTVTRRKKQNSGEQRTDLKKPGR